MNERSKKITDASIGDILRKESNGLIGLRVAKAEDIPSLISIINSAYSYENEGENAFKIPTETRVTEESVRRDMEEGIMIVATNPQSKGEILGCIQYMEIPGRNNPDKLSGYFGSFAVNPATQGQGTGRRLMQTVEEIGAQRGMDTMQIQVVNHSAHLLNLYSRYGYTEFERVDWHGSYLTKPTQFVLMEKPLRQPGTNQPTT